MLGFRPFDFFMRFNYCQLITIGVHIGHSFRNSLFDSAWIVSGFRKQICIINLFKFMFLMRTGLVLIKAAVSYLHPVWFATQEACFSQLVKANALFCGEFYSVEYWIHGMLSNFRYAFLSLLSAV